MRVGIVGAGITGLTLHHHLRRRSVECVTFEAAPEPGGVIRSKRVDGRLLEFGPQRTRLTPAVRTLVEAAGLDGQVVEASEGPLYVYRDGALRRVPRTAREAVTTDLLTWRGKARALLEPFAGPPRAGESVEAYLVRAFGREVAENLAGPLYAGLYASDPAAMPVERSLARAFEHLGVRRSVLFYTLRARLGRGQATPVVSFDSGLQALPRALAEIHRDGVAFDCPVNVIRRAGRGYELRTDGQTAVVDEVVLTVPAPDAGALLSDLDPTSARALSQLSYNPLAVVHLAVEDAPVGAGFQVALGESLVTRGATFNDHLLGRDGVHTVFLGGATNPEVVDWPDRRLGRVAAREFEVATGREAVPVHVSRIRPGMPAYDRTWLALDSVDPPDGVHLCANYESRAGIPGRVQRAERLARTLADRVASSEAPRERAAASIPVG